MADQALRKELLSLLGRNCFLHLDREGQQLYVTDFPLRNGDKASSVRKLLEEAGYVIVIRGQALWGIDLTKKKWQTVLEEAMHAPLAPETDETLPLLSLSRLWEKKGAADENIHFARMILLSGSGKKMNLDLLHRQLCREYALCLREKTCVPGPGCAGLLRKQLKGMCP